MRHSPLRHPVAVLRQLVRLGQTEFGDLSGCSSRTVQAVELGKLPLSPGLALRIANATGVSIKWLLDGDPASPPTADCPSVIRSRNAAYTYDVFEAHRAELEIEGAAEAGTGRENTFEQLVAASDFQGKIEKDDAILVAEFEKILKETRYLDERAIVRWRLHKFLAEIAERYRPAVAPAGKRRRVRAVTERP